MAAVRSTTSSDTEESKIISTTKLENIYIEREKEYNPFEHRNVAHSTSTIGSFFNLLKSSLGSGLLAMPAAFKHTGLIPGCIGTALVALIATHCVHILVSTSRQVCRDIKEPSLNYTDTCENTFKCGPNKLKPFSKHIRTFVDYAMAGATLGGTSVHVIFIASSIKNLCDHFAPDHNFTDQHFCWMLLPPLILMMQLRYLKFLVPFSILANICLLLTFLITCRYTFVGIDKVADTKLVVSVVQWPIFLSTTIFAIEGISVVMPTENQMAKPGQLLGCPGVLNVTMVFVAILYVVVGMFGYLKYGDGVQGSITLNLPQDEILAQSAKILVAVALFFTYCLHMFAPVDIIWLRIQHKIPERLHHLGQILLRTLSATLTVILAAAIPDLELLIGLVGAIFVSTLGLLIPVVVQTVHKWHRGLGRYNYILWKNFLLFLFYCIVLISGCYTAVSRIIERFYAS